MYFNLSIGLAIYTTIILERTIMGNNHEGVHE